MNYREEIEKRMAERKRLGREIDDLRVQWAAAVGPKTGEIVKANRYTYVGSDMVVDRANVHQEWNGKWEYRATGRVLNKDGTPGKREAEYRQAISDAEAA